MNVFELVDLASKMGVAASTLTGRAQTRIFDAADLVVDLILEEIKSIKEQE